MFLVLFKKENSYVYKDLIAYDEIEIKKIAIGIIEESITLTDNKTYEPKITFDNLKANKQVDIRVEIKTASTNMFGYDNSHSKIVHIGELLLVETKLDKQIELTEIKEICNETKKMVKRIEQDKQTFEVLKAENDILKKMNTELSEKNKRLNKKLNRQHFANVYKTMSEVSIEQLSQEIKNHPLVKARNEESYEKESDFPLIV